MLFFYTNGKSIKNIGLDIGFILYKNIDLSDTGKGHICSKLGKTEIINICVMSIDRIFAYSLVLKCLSH